MAESRGHRFATDSDMLYFLGHFNSKEITLNDVAGHWAGVSDDYMTISRISATAVLAGSMHLLQIACTAVQTPTNTTNLKSMKASSTAGSPSSKKAADVGGSYTQSDNLHAGINWAYLSECARPHKLFTPIVNEPSFHWDEVANEWVIISIEMLERRVRKCAASHVLGPWKCSYIAELNEDATPYDDENYIVYAGKAHPEIRLPSRFGGKTKSVAGSKTTSASYRSPIVVSYVPNTRRGPVELFRNEKNNGAYLPKFVAVEPKP
jgi:hypothetical protein